MGAKSEQLLVLKEEERLFLTYRSRINDQLNRLKVEELSILSAMRKSQEEDFSKEEINLDEIDDDDDDDDDNDEEDDNAVVVVGSSSRAAADISHLTSMTGGFRPGSVGVFRAADDDERMTTMEVDLGDFEGGNGELRAFDDFMTEGESEGRVTDFGHNNAPGPEVGGGGGGGGGGDLVPLDLGFETKIENAQEEEEEEEDD